MEKIHIYIKGLFLWLNTNVNACVILVLVAVFFNATAFSQQQIGYYPNIDGGFEAQSAGSLGTTASATAWSFVSSGNGQSRNITTTGGYGGGSYLTIGKTSTATTNSSTTINSNQVTGATFSASTKYVVQFHYRANSANASTPDPASFVFISADGSSGNRISQAITLATPTSWTKFTANVTTTSTTQTTTGTVGINIRTSTIGTAALIDVDNFVVYPADNQTTGAADVTAPNSVSGASSTLTAPTQVTLSWSVPSGGIDNGGYLVVRYLANPAGNDNPLLNAIYAVGDTITNTNNGVVVYTGKNTTCIDSLNVAINSQYYYRIYAADKAFNYANATLTSCATTHTPVNYYVDAIGGNDANTGTSSVAAWKTIAKINNNTFYAGDSVLLKCGSVFTGVSMRPLGSGLSGKPIVVSQYGTGATPQINAEGGGLHNAAAVYLFNQQYITISNLELTNNYAATNADTAIRYGVYVLATDAGTLTSITLKNLTIHDVLGTYDSTSDSGGIFINITGSSIVTKFDSLTIDGCKIYNVDKTGISNQSSWADRDFANDYGSTPWRPSTNYTIKNCRIDSSGGNGMIVRVAQSPLVQNNILWKCAKRYTGNAFFVFNCNDALIQYNESAFTVYNSGDADASGFDGDYRCRRTIFQYNYSHDNDGGFAVVVCNPGGTPSRFNDSCIFRYNISQNDGHFNGGIKNEGQVITVTGQTTNTLFYNNTIYSSTDFNYFIIHRRWGDAGSVYPDVTSYYNNIFYLNKSNPSYSMQSSTNNLFSYNNFYQPLGGTFPTDANAITTNPLFVNAVSGGNGINTVTGYKLLSTSSCINAGKTITNAPNADYWGNTVAIGNTDIGAFEFGSTWTGSLSTAWNTTGNWVDNTVPTSTSHVLIPSGKTNYPTISSPSYLNNLIVSTGATLAITDTLKIYGAISNSGSITATAGTVGFYGSAAQTIPANTFSGNTIQNLVINNSAVVTIGGDLNITGTLTPSAGTLTTGGYLTLVSNSTGTARIAQGSGSYLSGNVTVQRYIPSKTARRYSFLGSAVAQSIRNAWQQQVYITGNGTGGQTCGATTGNGGSTDKYNSNGFDKTLTNTPSMYTYAASAVAGSRYVGVPNTDYTNLSPGTGYKINIRGDRNSAAVSCDNQLNQSNPSAPEAVTLSATGTVTTGSVSVALNNITIHPYTLLANPYPCPISFNAFKASNSNINNKMWTYSPFGNGNYTSYSNGVIANAATGYDNTSGNYVASGQAFFVEGNTNGSVVFQESHKTSASIPNSQYFGTDNSQLIRLGLYATNGRILDEMVVRYNTEGSKTYLPNWDAVAFVGASQSLSSTKDSTVLAIATRSILAKQDTVNLKVESGVVNTFQLKATDITGFDSSYGNVILKDNYTGIKQNLLANPIYTFNITNDTASKGRGRFQLLVSKETTLPIGLEELSASTNNGRVIISWTVQNNSDDEYYMIERSRDGKQFASIGMETSSTKRAYTYADKELTDVEVLFYRIKTISKSGRERYSKTVSVIVSKSSIKLSIFPNPVGDILNINIGKKGTYTITLSDITGKPVCVNSSLKQSNGMVTVKGAHLPKGVYLVKVSDEKGNRQQAKFIKE